MSVSVLKKASKKFLIVPFIVLAGLILFTGAIQAGMNGVFSGSRNEVPQVFFNKYNKGGVVNLSSLDKPVIGVGSYESSGHTKIVLYKADRAFLLNYLRHTGEDKQIDTRPDTAALQEVTTFDMDISGGYGDGTQLVLPLETSGIWYLKMEMETEFNDVMIVRSSIGGVIKSTNDSFLLWSQDLNGKRSLAGVKTSLFDLTDTVKELSNAGTNDEGMAKLPFVAQADVALFEKDGQLALAPVNMNYFNSGYRYSRFRKVETNKYYLFSDRPLYKPGDTLYYKGMMRRDDDGRYAIPANQTFTVSLGQCYDDKETIAKKTLPLSDQGSLDGEFKIPETIAPGAYCIKMSDAAEGSLWNGSETWIQIEEYRKPEYFVELEAEKLETYIGEADTINFKGAYFSGQPLANATVTYTVTANDTFQPATRESLKYVNFDEYQYGYWHEDSNKITTGSVTLDAGGTGRMELPLSPSNSNGKIQIFTVTATYLDQTGNPVKAAKNILVHPAHFSLYSRDTEGWSSNKINQKQTLNYELVADEKGPSVSSLPVSVKIHRENWVKQSDDPTKPYVKEEEDLPGQELKSDRKGLFSLSFTPTKLGFYTITMTATDAQGLFVTKEFYLWVSNEDNYWYSGSYQSTLTILSDKESYQPGQMARLTIHSDVPDRDLFLTVQRTRVDRSQVIKMHGTTATVMLPITDVDMPNTFVQVSSFNADVLDAGNVELKVPANKKRIVVTLTPDRTTYGPGDTVSLQVKTADYQGKAVPAEVAVWSMDKAIFELSTDLRENIFKHFWSDRYNGAQTAHTLEHINIYSAEGGGGCFVAGTKVLLASGKTKNIEDVRVGDVITTRKSEIDPTLVSAKVTNTHHAEEPGYLIINGTLKVTPNHILWVNNTWKTASEVMVDDQLLGANGEQLEVKSVEWFAQKVTVYNLTVENYHTYFANGIWVHNQKGDVRSVLKDTAYWNPTVRTNQNGTATVTFKLPDNLTTWVISGVAANQETSVGEGKAEVITQKSVVVRPVIPNILRIGDKVQLSALVHNFTDADKNFSGWLEMTGVQFVDAQNPGKIENITVRGKGGIEQLFWDVEAKEANPATTLTMGVKATEGDYGDAIQQSLPIIPYGFKEESSTTGIDRINYSLNMPADAVNEYSQIELSLSSTMLGTLPSAIKYLLQYPYGCVEQTTSRFVPAVIVKANPAIFKETFKDKDLNKMLSQGVDRLRSLQNSDNGWGWVNYQSNKSDPFISAYVVEYLLAAKKAGVPVPVEILYRAENFFKNYETTPETLPLRIYVLQLLNNPEGKAHVAVDQSMTPDVISYAVMANYRNGEKNPDQNGLNVLLSKLETDGDLSSLPAGKSTWFGSRDASTALGLRAFTLAEANRETTRHMAEYLVRKRSKNYWSNTFATAQVIQAIVDFTKAGDDLTPSYKYTVLLDGQQLTAGTVNKSTTMIPPITIPASEGHKTLEVTKTGEGSLFSTLTVNQFRTDSTVQAEDNGLSITRKFVSERGAEYYPAVGDTVNVNLELEIPTNATATDYVVIEDQLPAGMVPINTNLKNEGKQDDYYWGDYWYGQEQQTKKDGAIFLLSNIKPGKLTVSYQARAITAGEFRVPPTIAANMYNPEVRGRTAASVVKITGKAARDPKKVVSTFISDWYQTLVQWILDHWKELVGGSILLGGLLVIRKVHKNNVQKNVPVEETPSQPPITPSN